MMFQGQPNPIEPREPEQARVWFYFDGRALYFYVRLLNGSHYHRQHPISFRLYLSRLTRAMALPFRRRGARQFHLFDDKESA